MSAQPVIGIVANLSIDPHYRFPNCPRYSVTEDYTRSVEAAGGVPILLGPTENQSVARAQLNLIDGLLLAGGQDLSPSLYGEAPGATTEPPESIRDAYEHAALSVAWDAGLPVLGICRGAQMLNVWRGGSLHQEIADLTTDIDHHGGNERTKIVHAVSIAPTSLLHAITRRGHIMVNSFHHQAIHKIGDGVTVSALAPDSVIEAIEIIRSDESPMIALQWHPEMLSHTDHTSQRLFAWLVAEAANHAARRRTK